MTVPKNSMDVIPDRIARSLASGQIGGVRKRFKGQAAPSMRTSRRGLASLDTGRFIPTLPRLTVVNGPLSSFHSYSLQLRSIAEKTDLGV